MAEQTTQAAVVVEKVYNAVVDDVVEKMKQEFAEEGTDEQILLDLREKWLQKLREAQAILAPPATTDETMQSNTEFYPHNVKNEGAALQQLDGVNYEDEDIEFEFEINGVVTPACNPPSVHGKSTLGESIRLCGQLDGAAEEDSDDGDDDDMQSDDEDAKATTTASITKPADNMDTSDHAEKDETLNSEDDGSDDDESDEECENIIICQYDKINHNKNKWRATLKEGIMQINGRDYMFQKATGEYEW